MRQLKVMTVLGTRPEIIRLACVLKRLDAYFDHMIVHTGQNYDYELNEIFWADLELRQPDIFLDAAGDSPADTIGNIIASVDMVLANHHPDALLILGDTNSCLAAIAAKRRKVPIFHMEAGNRCFDMRVPEEVNRKIVDHIADINLTYSGIAREYLLREGLSPQTIIKTGSPMQEVLNTYADKISNSQILKKLELTENRYWVVSAHREENIDNDVIFGGFVELLNKLAALNAGPVLLTAHPRTLSRIKVKGVKLDVGVRVCKPFSFTDYVKLQVNAKAVLSDSGTITEESSILNFPALNIRHAHERPEGFEEGAVMMVGMNWQRISWALALLERQSRGEKRSLAKVYDYQATNVSEKVCRIILSYYDYVNEYTWKK